MRKKIWKILLLAGICPFLLPFILSFSRMSTWSLLDWLVMYSFVYWPTYLAGFVLIVIAIYKLMK